ncbi:MAG: LysE family translocator [Caulobacteraceae bacterium]|nr:LysE family translocator [Caulobacteraceae bacterium]
MIDPHLFAMFMAGAVALNLTPGPDMAFVLAQSASGGARRGIAAALGIGVGALFHMMLAAFGLTALFAAWPLAFDIVRYAGAAYLVWIAIGMIRDPPHLRPAAREASAWTAFRRGVLTNVMNPKVAMFFIAYLPQFVSPHAGPTWAQILILGLAFDLSGTLVNSAVAFGGGRLADRMRRNPTLGRAMGWLSGGVMGALALRLAWPIRR